MARLLQFIDTSVQGELDKLQGKVTRRLEHMEQRLQSVPKVVQTLKLDGNASELKVDAAPDPCSPLCDCYCYYNS